MKFYVQRHNWLRGDSMQSMLLNKHGKRCCLGFVEGQLGVRNEFLLGVLHPRSTRKINILAQRVSLDNPGIADTQLAVDAMQINDTSRYDDETREKELIKLFEIHGHELTFME